MSEIKSKRGQAEIAKGFLSLMEDFNDFIFSFDINGQLLDIKRAGADYLHFEKDEALGKSLVEVIGSIYRDFLDIFITDITMASHREGMLIIRDRDGKHHYIEFKVSQIKGKEDPDYFVVSARNVTTRIKKGIHRLSGERLKGVMEMAGGTLHKLNHPLMIINNLSREIFSSMKPDDYNYQKMKTMIEQLKDLNLITKKISQIEKYEAMDYVAGLKIVDIDKSALNKDSKNK